MKKIFLSAVIALALCSYGYAQDDEEYEEEDEVPAKVVKKAAVEEEEEEEEEAPVAKKKEKKAKKGSSNEFVGFGIGWDQNPLADFNYFDIKFRINDQMQLAALFGLGHYGVTTVTAPNEDGVETDNDLDDDFTPFIVGAEFNYFLATPFLPTYFGARFAYASAGEVTDEDNGNKYSASALEIGLLFGVQASIVSSLYLSGHFGLDFDYLMDETKTPAGTKSESSRLIFGTSAGIEISWFFM